MQKQLCNDHKMKKIYWLDPYFSFFFLHYYNSFRMWEGKHKRGGKYSRYFWQKLQFCGCMLALFQPGWYQGEDEVGIWNLVEIACV